MSVFSDIIIEQVYLKLTGDSALMALVSDRIYDHVPQADDFPYIEIGVLINTQANTDDAEQISGSSLTIHTYSRENGRKECHDIQKRINQVLHRSDIVVSGFNFMSIDEIQAQSVTDADGLTRHGISEYFINITEV